MIAAQQIYLGRGGAGAKLPYDAEVGYLESTGTQYIDTLFKANTTTTKLQTSIVFNDTSTIQGVFGSRNFATGNSSSCNAFVISPTYFRPDWASGSGDANINITISTGVAYDIEITRGSLAINGTIHTYSIGNGIDQSFNFLLFNFSNGSDSPYSVGLKGRMMYAKLYSNNILVRDFQPVRFTNELGQSEGAMYDRVSKQLFRNQGTGAFLYGRDVNPISARSYVKDGLVAMWDGIENAGWGVHDANATVWNDLVGDLDIIVPSSDSFASDHLVHVSGTPQSGNDTRICEGTNLTVESVFEASSDSTIYTCNTQAGSGSTSNGSGFGQYSLRYQAAGNPSYSRFSRGNGTSWGYSTYSSIPTPIGEICSLVDVVDFDVVNNKYSYKYVNGQLANTYPFRGGPVGYTVTGKMRVFMNQPCHGHCLRIYNRALTAAEIAANYAVDKARFNLP